MTRRIAVIGGGVAGCATAVAAARAGARVTLLESAHFLGGVAAQGDHRTLCGLAPIDAAHPDLLEPALTAWVAALATGAPRRHGRVWLWPTAPDHLQAGLARRLADSAVEVRRGATVAAVESAPADPTAAIDHSAAASLPAHPVKNSPRALLLADGERLPIDTVVDASGGAALATALGAAAAPATPPNWPAFRAHLAGPNADHLFATTVARLRAEAAAAQAAAVPTAALVPIAPGRCQLSLDCPPGTTPAAATLLAERAAAALGLDLIACARSLAARDHGRVAGTLTLAELFATHARGWCWAAWPRESHGPAGLTWTWPGRDRHGIPAAAVRPATAPANCWWVGKGMPVAPEAAAALRVTGTALALGTALGAALATGATAPLPAPAA